MARPRKKVENVETQEVEAQDVETKEMETPETDTQEVEIHDKGMVATEDADVVTLPKKDLLRVDEVADYFSVSERTIRLWLDHGHLVKEKVVGSVRIPRTSVLECRFNPNKGK